MLSEPPTEDFIRELEAPLQRYACGIGLSQHDSEDVVQEALLRFTKALQQNRSIRNPKAYAFAIVRNCAMQKLRQSSRRKEVEISDEHPNEPDQASIFEDPSLKEAFRRAYAGLSAPDRVLLRKYYCDGWNLREIGEELGCSPQYVWKVLKKVVTQTLAGEVRNALNESDPHLAEELFDSPTK